MQGIFISGPMRGYPSLNYPSFYAAEKKLREKYPTSLIFNPARKDVEDGVVWEGKTGNEPHQELNLDLRKAMKADLDFICEHAKMMFLLPGWEKSKGAAVEIALGKLLGLRFETEEGPLTLP